MAPQVFYRKWRPQTLAEVVGQEQVTRVLLNALKNDRVAHAYLFCGPRGTGKTSTGRILAKAVNCLSTNGSDEPCNNCSMCRAITENRALDVIEIDAASNTGVDNIRDLRERANYTPSEARYKVYIIDEVHMLSSSASNALLKTLEEPPPHIIFVLATTEAHKVLPTVLSRCQHFNFRRIALSDVVSRLSHICISEGIKAPPETLKLIAKSATGSLRDAENILEQLITYYGDEISLDKVQAALGISVDQRFKEMVKHIVEGDVAAGIKTINEVSKNGLDLRQFNRDLIEYLRALLMIKTGAYSDVDLAAEDIKELNELSDKASLSHVLSAVKIYGQLASTGFDNYSTLPLELAMVDCVLNRDERTKIVGDTNKPEKTDFTAKKPVVARSSEQLPKKNKAVSVSHKTSDTLDTGEKAIEDTQKIVKEHPKTEEGSVDSPTPGDEIEYLRKNWKQVIENAPPDTQKTPAVAFLRSSSRPVAFKDNTVVLAFKFKIHKDNMEKPQNQQIAERIISNYLGFPCNVRCIYQQENNHLVEAALKMGAQIVNVEEK